MKSFFGLLLLSILCFSHSDGARITNGIAPHFNNLLARDNGGGHMNKLVARQDQTGNFQTFTGTLGSRAPTVKKKGGVFVVEFGSADEKFPKLIDAIIRSCDRQSNRCADFFNRKGQSKTQECNAQLTDCKKVATAQSGNAGPTLPADQNTQIQSGPITLSGQQTAQDIQLSQNTQTQTTQQIELTGQGSGDQNVQLDQNTQLQTGQTNQTAQVDQNTQLQTGQPDPNAQSVQLGQDTQISTDLAGPTIQTPPARPTDQSTRLADLAGPTIQTPPGRTTDQSTRVADLAGPTIQNLPGRTNDQTARLAGLPGSTTQNIRTSDKITVDVTTKIIELAQQPLVIKGKDGKDGIDGKDGRNGRNGKTGLTGPTGPTGPSTVKLQQTGSKEQTGAKEQTPSSGKPAKN